MTKVYIEAGQKCMEEVFTQIGCKITKDIFEADAAVLIGGADIDPFWYKKGRHPRNGGHLNRDQTSVKVYNTAWARDIAILGVCRGGQLINALCGGDMYQDVNHHTSGDHQVYDRVTKCYHTVNSIHHQMMIPTAKAICIAEAIGPHPENSKGGPISTYRELVEEGLVVDRPVSLEHPEWEVLYYPEVKGLCFQPHPEYDHARGNCRAYFYDLLKRYYPVEFGGLIK